MKRLQHPSSYTPLATAVAPALALALTLALMTPATGVATPSAGKVVPVDVTVVGKTAAPVDNVDCLSQLGVCELYFHGALTVSGTEAGNAPTGTADFALQGHFQPNLSFAFTNILHVTETRTVCGGQGAFEDVEHGVMSQFDLQQLGLAGHAEWNIAPGSGTGALTGATGGGYLTAVLYPDGRVHARVLGAITCPPTDPAAIRRSRSERHPAAHHTPARRAEPATKPRA